MILRGTRARNPPSHAGRPLLRRGTAVLIAICAAATCSTACAGAKAHATRPALPPAARTRAPVPSALVLAGTAADVVAAEVAQQFFAAAPVVVVASASGPPGLAVASSRALQAHAPLLLAAARAGESAALRAEILALHPRTVLTVGSVAGALSPQPRGIHVVTQAAELPATSPPTPLRSAALIVHAGDTTAATEVAATTAQVAGVTVIPVRGDDPRADVAAIAALAAARPRHVVAIGAGFGPAARLAARVAVAATGVQLPGGGQVIFPGHRLVALYGHPGAPALGALGQQGLQASIARIRRMAASYQRLSSAPVIPAFEVIATVALGSPGRDRDYSAVSSVADLRPWVRRATAAGMYVVLDLQPGRANLLSQAKLYSALLTQPNVGLALDPEWKLQPGQVPLRQIGGADISEINSVVRWLASLTARHHLPQKLLVLHQFRLSMIQREAKLDTHHDDLAIVIHMDGQGTPGNKQMTWNAVTAAAPRGVFFGWKNFYVEDHPTLSPRETMANRPAPVVISYQ